MTNHELATLNRFLSAIRPTYEHWGDGRCFRLHVILRAIWPDAKAMYEPIEGHVYTEIDGTLVDISGTHRDIPNLEPLKREHKFWRWE